MSAAKVGPPLEAAPPQPGSKQSERLATFRRLRCHVLVRGGRPATSRWSNCRAWEGGEGCWQPPAGRPAGSGSKKGGPTTIALCDLPGRALLRSPSSKISSLSFDLSHLELQHSKYRAALFARPKAKRAADLPGPCDGGAAGRRVQVAGRTHRTKTWPSSKRRVLQRNFSVAV